MRAFPSLFCALLLTPAASAQTPVPPRLAPAPRPRVAPTPPTPPAWRFDMPEFHFEMPTLPDFHDFHFEMPDLPDFHFAVPDVHFDLDHQFDFDFNFDFDHQFRFDALDHQWGMLQGIPTPKAPIAPGVPWPEISAMTSPAALAPVPGMWSGPEEPRGALARLWPEQGSPEDSLYRRAREALNRGEYNRASTLFQSLEQKYPRSRVAPADRYKVR